MKTTRLKRVTIVGENSLEEDIVKDLHDLGAKGYTYTVVHGGGATGMHPNTWTGPNAKIEVIATAEVADRILERISKTYFKTYAVIVYTDDVEVLRAEKFGAPPAQESKP